MLCLSSTTFPTDTAAAFVVQCEPNPAAAFVIAADVGVRSVPDFRIDSAVVTISPLDVSHQRADVESVAEAAPSEPATVSPGRKRVFDAGADIPSRSCLPFGRTFRTGLLVASSLLAGGEYADAITHPVTAEVAPPAEPVAVVEDEPPTVVANPTTSRLAVYDGVANVVSSRCPLADPAFVVGGNTVPSDSPGKGRWELAVGRRAGLAQVQVIGGVLASTGMNSSLTDEAPRLAAREYNRLGRAELTATRRTLSHTEVFSGTGFTTLAEFQVYTRGLQTAVFVG